MLKNHIAMFPPEEIYKPNNQIRLCMWFDGDIEKDINITIFSIDYEVSLTYLIDEINKVVTIDLKNRDLSVKFNNLDNLFNFIIDICSCKQLKGFQFVVTIMGITYIQIPGWLPNCNLTIDAEIIQILCYNMQYGLNLDAPNLKELTVNIETSKIMILSDQTPKDFKLITEGKEGYFYDPYFEYDPCS